MKNFFTSLFVLFACSSAWAQWDLTFDVSPTQVSQLAFSNCMVEVVCTNPDQVWTAVNTDQGNGCGNGFWAHKQDINGNVLGSFYISLSGWDLHVNAMEQFWGDIFIAGSMTNCNTGSHEAFIMAMDNSGGFSSAYRFQGNGLAEVADLLPLEPKTASSSNFMAIGFTTSSSSGFDPFVIVFDQGLNVVSTDIYPMGGVYIPYQGVVNASNNVSIVGTVFGSTEKLFMMELKKNAVPVGAYVEYTFSGKNKYRTPSLCLWGSDLLVTAQVDASTGSDIIVSELSGSGYSMNWSNTYDFKPADDGVQIFDNSGDMIVSFGSTASGTEHNGMMYLDGVGGFVGAETFQSFSSPKPVCAIQSSASADLVYQASYFKNLLNVVEEGPNVSSNCEDPWSTQEVSINTSEQDYPLDNTSWATEVSVTFSISNMGGDIYDCGGTGISGFKKGTVGLEELNTLDVNVYPSQTMGTINIQTQEEGIAQVAVYTMEGKLIQSENLSNGTGVIDLAGFPTGSYLLEITSEAGHHRQVVNKL